MPSFEGEKVSKKPNMINISSTSLRISARLDNKPKQKYGLFSKLSLQVIGSYEVADNHHVFFN